MVVVQGCMCVYVYMCVSVMWLMMMRAGLHNEKVPERERRRAEKGLFRSEVGRPTFGAWGREILEILEI